MAVFSNAKRQLSNEEEALDARLRSIGEKRQNELDHQLLVGERGYDVLVLYNGCGWYSVFDGGGCLSKIGINKLVAELESDAEEYGLYYGDECLS